MKALFFDAGPIITLVMSRLIWILPKLKEKYGGKFYITPAVKRELVERPLTIHRFQFEALQVMRLINEGILEVYTDVPQKRVDELISLANKTFSVKKRSLDIVQEGEVESISTACQLDDAAVVMDERTLRLFIEKPENMESLLEHRFKHDVKTDLLLMKQFQEQLKGVTIIRSIELVGVAFKLGMLDCYLPQQENAKELLLESVLWATKYNGCAVTNHEIEELKQFLLK